MSKAQEDAELMDEIRKRLIQSGEWDRISQALRAKLEEAGWEDDLRDLAKERVRAQETPNLQALLREIQPIANDMIPKKVQDDVLQEIQAALEQIVEPA